MKKWVSRITTVIFTLTFILMAVAVIVSKASGGEPNMFGYQIKPVLSGSMEPSIHTGSIITVKPGGDMTRFQKGDVITFKQDENTLVTHRILDVIKNGEHVSYETKGDNNEAPDMNPVLSQNVVGEYTGVTIPYMGYALDFAKSSKGTSILLILPGVLLLIYAAITIWKAISQLDGKRSEQLAAPTSIEESLK